ncbi:MAG TPA: GAF domain-containing protein [Anaerolineales bacterium]|nr:GAF domain-containing protein [Anaerolineales bacterium]
MIKRLSFERFLQRTGGWSLIVLIAVAQILSLIGAIPGLLSIRVNAESEQGLLESYFQMVPILVLVTNLVLLAVSWWITPAARKRLSDRALGIDRANSDDEFLAWREITSLTWRHALAGGLLTSLLVILPGFLLTYTQGEQISSAFQPTALTASDPIYILIGGIVALFGSVMLAILLIERFTLPIRLMLVPRDFEMQLRGRSGLLLNGKFLTLTLVLILIAILLIAPIGYQHTVRVLYAEISSMEIFRGLQFQSVVFSALALLLGAGFSYYLAKAVSDPIYDLIKTFNKIEQGDLTQRAPVSSTDELGIVTMQFNRMVARLESLQSTLEQQVVERTKQLAASNEVGKAAASSLDPEQLLARVVPLFPEQFGYYYAAIYLLDPSGRWAELREATGEAGKVLKQNHHRLEVSGKSMVGTAIREQSPRIAQVASDEKQRMENPILPYTRSEIALPLMVGDRVLGALNVQSTREADFGPQVIETMKNMAGQVAIALENARLFQEAQQVIRELRTVQQQYLFEGWSGFAEDNEKLEYRIGDEEDDTSRKLEVPISLRDQILGQILLEGQGEWSADQQTLVNAVATQAAIALENARLVSESRQIALRERMVADINSKIWASATIDGVLQTVIKELGRRLNASSATIELNIDPGEEA